MTASPALDTLAELSAAMTLKAAEMDEGAIGGCSALIESGPRAIGVQLLLIDFTRRPQKLLIKSRS